MRDSARRRANGTPTWAGSSAGRPGGRSPRAKRAWWSAIALFLPFGKLGLIVVDEEHDPSFKQEDGVTYHARDMAVVRARLGEIRPSSSRRRRRWRRWSTHAPAAMWSCLCPTAQAAGRHPGRGDRYAPRPARRRRVRFALVARRAGRDARGRQQALLFLNRRGYAPLTLCRACGHRIRCPSCTAWLVEHRLVGRLQCHYCGFATRLPSACPACRAQDSLAACGPGVERLAEEVALLTLAPSSPRPIRYAGPPPPPIWSPASRRHEVDLIIGTQIIAKGYHFPLLTLVGVVDADLGLSGGDLRASERTFQLLYQVGGRGAGGGRAGAAADRSGRSIR